MYTLENVLTIEQNAYKEFKNTEHYGVLVDATFHSDVDCQHIVSGQDTAYYTLGSLSAMTFCKFCSIRLRMYKAALCLIEPHLLQMHEALDSARSTQVRLTALCGIFTRSEPATTHGMIRDVLLIMGFANSEAALLEESTLIAVYALWRDLTKTNSTEDSNVVYTVLQAHVETTEIKGFTLLLTCGDVGLYRGTYAALANSPFGLEDTLQDFRHANKEKVLETLCALAADGIPLQEAFLSSRALES